jgi:RHS repeat-associated protein
MRNAFFKTFLMGVVSLSLIVSCQPVAEEGGDPSLPDRSISGAKVIYETLLDPPSSLEEEFQAAQFCQIKEDYDSNITCQGSFKIKSIADLSLYIQNGGLIDGKYKDASIDGSLNVGDLELHSPCQISFSKNTSIQGNSICLDARKGFKASKNSSVTGTKVSILSLEGDISLKKDLIFSADQLIVYSQNKITLDKDSSLNATGNLYIVATGGEGGESGNVFFKKDSALNAERIVILSDNSIIFNKDANLSAVSSINAKTLGSELSDLILLKKDSNTVSKNLNLASEGTLQIEKDNIVDTTDNLYFNAPTCILKEVNYLNNPAKKGKCFYPDDFIAPVVSTNLQSDIFTNQVIHSFNVSSVDINPVTTFVYLNGELVYEEDTENANVSINLADGVNQIEVLAIDFALNKSETLIFGDIVLDRIPPVLANILPNEGSYLKSSDLLVTGSSNEPLILATGNSDTLFISPDHLSFSGSVTSTEGPLSINVVGTDRATNSSTVVRNIFIDNTVPEITITNDDNQIINTPLFLLKVEVSDNSPIINTIIHNGIEVSTSPLSLFDTSLTLVEGINTIEVRSIDAAGNVADVKKLNNIELDTIAPILTNFIPEEGKFLSDLQVLAGFDSNEQLQMAKLNGSLVGLSQNLKKASGTAVYQTEGVHTLNYEAVDLAGNTTSVDVEIEIILKLLREELISISATSGSQLEVRGGIGASRPGVEIEFSAGIGNNETIYSNSDGSFVVFLNYFTSVSLHAEDAALSREETVTLNYAVDTSLSGVVRDKENNPLPGVTVTIESSGQSAETSPSGSFSIQSPSSGLQKLIIDGRTIPSSVSGPNKVYSKTSINVNIGVTQQNLIERPIYLCPLLLDGSETPIPDDNTAVLVTSPHAPGVEIEIPAGMAVFPDGTSVGSISMGEISSEFASIAPVEYAVPDTVYALEPSGLKFKERVKLVVPNVNEFPAGMKMIIFSKNSDEGFWEVDALATVSDDGSRIETNDQEGISHFSEVYAAPYAPDVREYGSKDRPGADTNSGILTTSVSLPSYKSLGQDVSPGLIYKSTWANPNTIVSNLFHVPRNEVFHPGGGVSESKFGFRGTANTTFTTWLNPEYVDAQFFSEDFVSEKMRFEGLPRKALVSYAMDLGHLENGIHPYNSRYELKLRQMIMSVTTRSKKKPFGRTKVLPPIVTYDSKLIDQVYNSSIVGSVPVESKINSSVGRGWDIAGVQKILNPNSSYIMLDEGSGSFSTYGINSTLEVLYDSPYDSLRGINFNWPEANFSNREDLFTVDLTTGSEQNEGRFKVFEGIDNVTRAFAVPPAYLYNDWRHYHIPYTRFRNPAQVVKLSSGRFIGTGEDGSFFDLDTDGTSSAIYPDKQAGEVQFTNSCVPGNPESPSNIGRLNCGAFGAPFVQYIRRGQLPPNFYPNEPPSNWPLNGNGIGAFSDLRFNTPVGIIHKFSETDVVLVADSGNNRIVEVDFNNNTSRVFAGNGNNYNNGDGGAAIDAGIMLPQFMVYDSVGNLFITSGEGYVRKINPQGIISTIAGNPNGSVTNESKPLEMFLSNPKGLAFDNDNQFLYVSDSGQHRVVRVDLNSNIASTVAGNFQCITSGNYGAGGSALNASLCSPNYLGLDENNNLLIGDEGHKKIFKVNFNFSNDGSLSFIPTSKDNSTLKRLSDKSFVRSFRNGSKIHYDSTGKQTESIDRTGREVLYEYEQDKLVKMTDPLGSETSYVYSGDKLTSIIDPAGRQTNLTFDGDKLSVVTFPDGSTKKYNYDAVGLMTSEVDQRNQSTIYEFGPYKRLKKVIRADLSEIEVFNGTSLTIGNSFTGGSTGEMKGQDNPEIVDGIKDAKNNITEFKKDLDGYVSTITDAQDRVTTVQRDIDGRPTKITRPDGSTVDFTYDAITNDLLSKVDSATGVTIAQSYDSFGNLLSQNDPRGNLSQNAYDPLTGLLLTQTNQLNQTTTNTYYDYGLLKTRKNNLNQIVTFEYDPFGNLSKQIDPEGNETIFFRDGAGNVTKVRNAKGQETINSYDAFNRLTSVTTPKLETTSYEYLATGELSKIIDPNNNTTNFEYDILGRLIKKTDSLGKVTELAYDKNGNVIQETDPNGNIKTFEYDNLDQLTKRILPDNTYEFDYDVRGNVSQIKNLVSQIDFIYERNEAGDLVDAVQTQGLGAHSDLPTFEIEYDYDVSGNRTNMVTDIGDFSYNYDLGNRLTGLTNHKAEAFNFTYDVSNRLTRIQRPGSETLFNFDDTNFLTSIVHQHSGNINISNFSYVKDLIGNRTSLTTNAGTSNYNYDNNNQLIQGTNPESLTENYTYDSNGNRLTDDFGSYNYDASSQRLTEDYRYFYFYDQNGNISSKNSKTDSKVINYIHNSENQLVGIDYFDGVTPTKEISYVYDALGRRVKKIINDLVAPANSFTRKYVYDGNEILAEFDTDNKLLATYTHSTLRTDDALAVDVTADGVTKNVAQSAQSYFYIKDGQGTVVDVVDGAGSIVQHHVYSAFGELVNILDQNGAVVTAAPILAPFFTYTGREYDQESSLYHYRARTYDASLGRFLQVDPDPGLRADPRSFLSQYIYTKNDPINRVDPSGEFSINLKKTFGLGLIGIFPINGLLGLNTTNFFQSTFGFDSTDKKRVNLTAAAALGAGAFVATGGAGVTVAQSLKSLAFLAGGSTFSAFLQDGNFTDNFLESFAIATWGGAAVNSFFNIGPIADAMKNDPNNTINVLGATVTFKDFTNASVVYFSTGKNIVTGIFKSETIERRYKRIAKVVK